VSMMFQKKCNTEEEKSAPSGSIFKCPEGSSRVFMSCKPPFSCPGRAPPQHAFNILLYVCVCKCVCVVMTMVCGSPLLLLHSREKMQSSCQEKKKVTPIFFPPI